MVVFFHSNPKENLIVGDFMPDLSMRKEVDLIEYGKSPPLKVKSF
jgi:hypothetical protein